MTVLIMLKKYLCVDKQASFTNPKPRSDFDLQCQAEQTAVVFIWSVYRKYGSGLAVIDREWLDFAPHIDHFYNYKGMVIGLKHNGVFM